VGPLVGAGGGRLGTGGAQGVGHALAQGFGLRQVLQVLKDVDGISMTFFNARDVVRHPLVRKIIAAYDAEGQKMMAARPESEAPKAKSKPQNPES
jgi:phosphate starvation-inducible PhoH-like protein